MEFMRNAAKTWVAKLLMALLVLSFGIWGIRDVSTSFLGDFLSWTGWGPKDLVRVAGQTIRQPEYNAALQRALQSLSAQTGQHLTIDDAKRMGVDKTVLDNMIAAASVDAEGQKLKLAISNQTILQSLANNKMFQDAAGKFDATIFKRVLDQNNLSEQDFLASEKSGRLRNLVTGVANDTLKLPKTLSTALAQYRGEARDVKYFDFTVAEADVPAITDDELKKQYETNPAAYTAPEYRSLAIMKVEPADIATRISVNADELQAGYDQYKLDYYTPEKRTVLQLTFPNIDAAKAAKKRLDAGEDFMKLGAELKLKDTDITLADRQISDFLDSKIAEAAFKLAANAISEPVQGDLAIAILKVSSISPEKQSTLNDVKPALTTRLQLEKAKEEITAIYNEVEDGRSQQTPFEKIAENTAIPFQLVSAISAVGQDKAGKDVTIANKEQVLKSAFLSDVGNSDDALPFGDGYVWYEVREVVPPTLKLLADIKADVLKDVMAAKLRDLAATKAKDMVANAKAGTSLDALAAKASATVKTALGLKRNETSQEFDGQAVSSLYNVGDQGFAWSLAGDGKTARIMQITKVALPAIMATSPDIKKLQDEATTGLGNDLSETFIASLRKAANVTINEELWKQNTGTDIQQP
jgi:peptidyl-prolyl cis-trans isomerase D